MQATTCMNPISRFYKCFLTRKRKAFMKVTPQSQFHQQQFSLGQLVWFKKGQQFSLVKPGIWQIYQGVIQLDKVDINEQKTFLGWGFSNSAFSLELHSLNHYQGKALSDIYLRWFAWKDLETFPQLNFILLPQLVRRLEHTKEFVAIAKLGRVKERLLKLLHLLNQEIGQPQENGILLPFRFTHGSLAQGIGACRVTVTKGLGELQEKGLIKITPQHQIWMQN